MQIGKTKFRPYEIFTKMMSLGRSMRSHCHHTIEKDGFTLNETDVLLALTSSPENNTVKAISEAAGISKGNISQAVETLRVKGYIATETDPTDRRYITIRLTEAAAPTVEKLQAAEDEYFSKFMGTLSEKNASLVTRVFKAIQKYSPTVFLSKLTKKEKENETANENEKD